MSDLRQELKAWEREFAALHGHKPSRSDIKQDPRIEAKYKAYNQANKSVREKNDSTPSRNKIRIRAEDVERPDDARVGRERDINATHATPRRALKSVRDVVTSVSKLDHKTCTRIESENQCEDLLEPDPTPAYIRCALGPTPQKDGQILGIFDMLPSVTPSKPFLSAARPVSRTQNQNQHQNHIGLTPTKNSQLLPAVTTPSTCSRTPQSKSIKRSLFDAFSAVTPKRQKTEAENNTETTPSASRQAFATPSFLRRRFPLATILESGTESIADRETGTAGGMNMGMGMSVGIPQPAFKKRNMARSFSAIIRNLRNIEEERMDEELDILNEMEAEQDGLSHGRINDRRGRDQNGDGDGPRRVPQLQVENTQVGDLPLGPDRGYESGNGEGERDDERGKLDENGVLRRPYKKKGLKRQTKKVSMRPVLHKPRKESDGRRDVSESDDAPSDDDFQKLHGNAQRDGAEGSDESGGDSDDDGDVDVRVLASPSRKRSRKTRAEKDKVEVTNGTSAEQATTTRKKVSAQAHANFRRLKIKNKNSKANGRGRFGRR